MQKKEKVLLHRLCLGIRLVQQAIRIECDSESAIFLAKNTTYHPKTKNIDGQYCFMRDMIENKTMLQEKLDTLKKVVDSLVKYVRSKKFPWFRETMGTVSLNC